MKLKIKVNLKKLISVLLCSILISSTISPITTFASNEISVSNFQELKNAIENAKSYNRICLTKDIEITEDDVAEENNVLFSISDYKYIEICGNNHTIKAKSRILYKDLKFFFYVNNHSQLDLSRVTIDGSNLPKKTHFIGIANKSNLKTSGITIQNFGKVIQSDNSNICFKNSSITSCTRF